MAPSVRPARAPGDPIRQLADHRRALDELQRDPLLNARTIIVNLPDGVKIHMRHGLGRPFINALLGVPEGAVSAGYIVKTPGDDTTEVILTANGYGATITVAVTVW